MTPAPTSSSPVPPSASRAVRWWRRRTGVPAYEDTYRPLSTRDLLSALRMMMFFMSVTVALMLGLIVSVFAGFALPGWVIPVFGWVAVLFMASATPGVGATAVGLGLESVRRGWAHQWLDEAGVPLRFLWRMLGSPITPNTYRSYIDAFTLSPTHDEVDPRLVWWLVVHDVPAEEVARYRSLGVQPDLIPLLWSHDLTPDVWARIDEAQLDHAFTPDTLVRILGWIRTSKASLHPDQFTEVGTAPRSADDAVGVLLAWTWTRVPGAARTVSTRRAHMFEPCKQFATKSPVGFPCPDCLGTEETGHEFWFLNSLPLWATRCGDTTVGEWIDATGLLFPYFCDAGVPFTEARDMVASGNAPTVEALVFMAALSRSS